MLFSYHMSYDEVASCLEKISEENRCLSPNEWACLEHSLKDHLLQTLLTLYPLTAQARAVVRNSLEQRLCSYPTCNERQEAYYVCDIIYSGHREQLAQFLLSNFNVEQFPDFKSKIIRMIRKGLTQPSVRDFLIESENKRYYERLFLFESCELLQIQAKQSFKQICKDFDIFITYWFEGERSSEVKLLVEVVKSLVLRYEGLQSLKERHQAEFCLIKAFDKARTTYHTQQHCYFSNNSYSSTESFIDLLLDEHDFLRPPVTKLSKAAQLVQAFTAPFVHGELGQRPTFSRELYFLYLVAAGYPPERFYRRIFKLNPAVEIVSLSRAFYQKMRPTTEQERRFDTILVSKEDISADPNDSLINFLVQQGCLIPCPISYSPPSFKTEEEILQRMEQQGPFIDRTHLLTVLALSCPQASTALLHQAVEKGECLEEHFTTTSKETILQAYKAYQDYLRIERRSVFYYYDAPKEFELHTIITNYHFVCSQRVCTDYIEKNISNLNKAERDYLIYFIITQGFDKALVFLLDSGILSVHDYCRVQGISSLLIDVAAEAGHAHIVGLLIVRGASFENSYALQKATLAGHAQIVQLLLEAGVNPEGAQGYQNNLLFRAIDLRYDSIARLLIKYSPQQARDEALLYAIQNHRPELVKFLIYLGANPHVHADYVLGQSIADWQPQILSLLLDAGVNPNTLQKSRRISSGLKHYRTPLGIAIFEKESLMARLLIKAGADLGVVDGLELLPPLELAISLAAEAMGGTNNAFARQEFIQRQDLVKTLIEEGAQLIDQRQYPLLKKILPVKSFLSDFSSLFRQSEIPPVELKKKEQSCVDCYNQDGVTELMQAIIFGNTESVAYLISQGANINKVTPGQDSCLDLVVIFNRESILEICLKAQPSAYCLIKALETAKRFKRSEMALAICSQTLVANMLPFNVHLKNYYDSLMIRNENLGPQENELLYMMEPRPLLYTSQVHKSNDVKISCWKC